MYHHNTSFTCLWLHKRILCETSTLLHSHGCGHMGELILIHFLHFQIILVHMALVSWVMQLYFQSGFGYLEKLIVRLWHCFIHMTLLHFQFNPFSVLIHSNGFGCMESSLCYCIPHFLFISCDHKNIQGTQPALEQNKIFTTNIHHERLS